MDEQDEAEEGDEGERHETLDRRDDEAVTEFENEGGENTVGGSTESQPLHTRRDAAADEHGSHRRETS